MTVGETVRMNAFDPRCTNLRPLLEYSKRLPSSRPGKRLNRSTLIRWALHGVRGGVKLPTVCLGGCRFTSDAFVAEFMRQLTVADELGAASFANSWIDAGAGRETATESEDRARLLNELGLTEEDVAEGAKQRAEFEKRLYGDRRATR